MLYLGIDLGGTNISTGIVDENGNILVKASTPTIKGRDAEDILDDMAELSKKLMNELNVTEKDIEAIGVGLPGMIDKKREFQFMQITLNLTILTL